MCYRYTRLVLIEKVEGAEDIDGRCKVSIAVMEDVNIMVCRLAPYILGQDGITCICIFT